jgi:Spy/CpxP family protein refolding chaperone
MVALLLVSSAALAHPGFGGRPGMMRRMGPAPLQQLQLSEDQRAQIKTIFSGARENIQPLAQQLREKHAALMDTARAQPFDETSVRAQTQEIADIQAQLMFARAQVRNRFLAVLTDEQKARLSELRAERLQQFQEWRKQRLGRTDPS